MEIDLNIDIRLKMADFSNDELKGCIAIIPEKVLFDWSIAEFDWSYQPKHQYWVSENLLKRLALLAAAYGLLPLERIGLNSFNIKFPSKWVY